MVIERVLGERFKSASGIVGTVVSIWPGLGEFDVRTDDGKTVKFIGDENEYDRCAGCGHIDPTTHRWYFARALLSDDAADRVKILYALDGLKRQMAAHVKRFAVEGDASVEGPVIGADGTLLFKGTVTPRVLCNATTEAR
jgi:hypothetical protein